MRRAWLGAAVALLVACRGADQSSEIHAFGGVITPGNPPVSLATLSANIPGTEAGQGLGWDGSTWAVKTSLGSPKQRYYYLEEFESGTACTTIGKFTAGGAVGATTCAFATESGHQGELTISTPATATDGARLSTTNGLVFGTPAIPHQVTWLIKISTVSTSVNQYVIRAGFAEPLGTSANSIDAVQAVYQFSANGGVHVWALETRSASTSTVTKCDGTGGTHLATVTDATWYELKLNVNAAGTSASLTVNGDTCATNTTQIPTTATAIGLQFFNDSGSTPAARLLTVDYAEYTSPFGVAR
jgi:hypothetical protein